MENKNVNFKQIALWVFVPLLLISLFQNLKMPQTETEIPYSTFKAKLREGNVSDVRVRPDLIRGQFKDEGGKIEHFRTLPLAVSNMRWVAEVK